MEVDEFVRQTLEQIIRGVKGAHAQATGLGARVGSDGKTTLVEFDLAVTVNESGEASAGVGIIVLGVGIGAKGKRGSETSIVSRMKFSVPVMLPATHPREKASVAEMKGRAERG